MKNWFQLKRDTDKKHWLIFGGIGLAFTIIAFILSVHWATSIIGGVLVFFILQFKLKFTDKSPIWIQSILLVIFSLIEFLLMQVTISCGFFLVGALKFIMNVIIILGFTALIWLATGKLKVSVIAVTVLTQVIAIADHLVVQARSFEIQFSDIFSLKTAGAVADQYAFTLSEITKIGIILSIFFIVILVSTDTPRRERNVKQIITCATSIVAAAVCIIIVYTQFGASVIGYQDKYWKYRGSERNGFFVNMVYSASATRILSPKDYDPDTLDKQVESYIAEHSPAENENKKQPNVIVIMNETFADVQNITEYMGGEMNTDVEITPFIDSLDDSASNVIKGHALSSVYGGNTANSELEFLSGLSVQFIPRNTVAYNLYIQENNAFTIVDSFNEAGYQTSAIHPENPTNWQRNKIYDYFNFQEVYFKDAFADVPEEDYYRGHISDNSVYEKIIELYEGKEEGTPFFNFSITMQNHSGYTTLGFDFEVEIEGKNGYTGIREYLSAIRRSDEAFRQLVEYFEGVEEDTIIVFFGDHQPSLSNIASKFYGVDDDDPTLKQLSKYAVPYVFWANYDIECERATSLTSINFLSSWLRDLVDVPETQFQKFIDALNTEVMAINAMGWFDHDGNFHESGYSKPNLNDPLKLYSYLQYNMLFDEAKQDTEIYALPPSKKD